MRTTLRQHGEVNVLTVDGALVLETVGAFNSLIEQCRRRDGRDFVVDLQAATTVDSAGLEALTALQRNCDERLGLLKLCGLNDTMTKILQLTRLDRDFDCRQDLGAALAALS